MGQSASSSANNQHRKITSQDKAILQLKKSRDNLNRFTTNTYTLIDNENLEIKKLIRSCKESKTPVKSHPGIKLLLKRVHYQKILISRANDQLTNLEEMISNIEFKLVEKKFLQGLQQGNDILKKLNKELNIDYVQDVMDTLHDEMAYEREVDEVLTSNMVGISSATADSHIILDDELDKELEEMGMELDVSTKKKEDTKDIGLNLPNTSNLPNLPVVEDSNKHPSGFTEEDEELEQQQRNASRVMIPSS